LFFGFDFLCHKFLFMLLVSVSLPEEDVTQALAHEEGDAPVEGYFEGVGE
jgi:hypothetical protein